MRDQPSISPRGACGDSENPAGAPSARFLRTTSADEPGSESSRFQSGAAAMRGAAMTYEQVRDILNRIRSFHRRLRDELEQVRPTSKDRRTQFLLEALRRDEQAMNIALAKYQRHGGVNVLDTWIQYVPDEETQRLLTENHFSSDMDPEEMLARKAGIDKALADLYRSLSEQTSATQVGELFAGLAQQTLQRLTQESWKVLDDDLAPSKNGDFRRPR
jgi:hypothetical protein